MPAFTQLEVLQLYRSKHTVQEKYQSIDTIDILNSDMITNCSYLVHIEILSEKGALLCGRLPAVIGQDLSEG